MEVTFEMGVLLVVCLVVFLNKSLKGMITFIVKTLIL